MSRQHVDFKVTGTDKDSGESDNTAIKPVADGEPGQAAVFKRPSENLRTRSEFLRSAVDDLRFLSDYDRQLLLTSTGTIAWAGLPTGTFTASADLTVKPFLAPNASTAARLIICANTQAQITFRTRQNGVAGQPRAYNGANTITFDFTPVTTGTGAIVVTSDGTPNNNVHIQYDDHAVSGTTVDQIPANSMVQQFNASAVAIALGLEAVVEGTGTPPEVGFPTPPASVAASKIKDYITVPEQATRYMAGAADAEKHNITPAHLTTFFSDPLNVLLEGDVVAVSYDELVMSGDGGRRQSIDEFPEDKADSAGLNLFLVRRFPTRMPLAIPLAAVVNGQLIFINGRAYGSGESGPLIPAGSSYQGSSPNQWADTSTLPASSFEGAIDSIVNILGTKTGGTPGAIKVGFTPAGNIAANTVKGALEELDAEKAGLANNNTFTGTNTFNDAVIDTTAITATGNGTGSGGQFTGGVTNGFGVVAQGQAGGAGIQASGGITGNGVIGNGGSTSGVGVEGWANGGNDNGVWGHGNGSGYGVRGTGGASGTGVHGLGQGAGHGVTGQGGTSGNGGEFTGGTTNGTGVLGTGFGAGSGGTFYAHSTSGPGNAALNGISQSTAGSKGVWGVGTGAFQGGYFTGGSTAVASYATRMNGAGVEAIGGGAGTNGVVARGGSGSTIGASSLAFANCGIVAVASGGGSGVEGISSDTAGTYGVSGRGSTGVVSHGVHGQGNSTGYGVVGDGGGTGAGGHGVLGNAGNNGSYGVWGQGTSFSGFLVFGFIVNGGPGGRFAGSDATDGTSGFAPGFGATGGTGGKGIVVTAGAGSKGEVSSGGLGGTSGTGGEGATITGGNGPVGQTPFSAFFGFGANGITGGNGGRGITTTAGNGGNGSAGVLNGGSAANGGDGGSGSAGIVGNGGQGGNGGAGVGSGTAGIGGAGGYGGYFVGGNGGTGDLAGFAGVGVYAQGGTGRTTVPSNSSGVGVLAVAGGAAQAIYAQSTGNSFAAIEASNSGGQGFYTEMGSSQGGNATRSYSSVINSGSNTGDHTNVFAMNLTSYGRAAMFYATGTNRGTIQLVARAGDPGSPQDGDMWVTTAGALKVRLNGTVRTVTVT